MYKPQVTWGDDIIDSRAINSILAELESEFENLEEEVTEAQTALEAFKTTHNMVGLFDVDGFDEKVIDEYEELVSDLTDAENALDEFDKDELETFRHVVDEGELYSGDWSHGVALILNEHFRTYAEELANDLGLVDSNKVAPWPINHIDWDSASNQLKQDYVEIEVKRYVYYVQNS